MNDRYGTLFARPKEDSSMTIEKLDHKQYLFGPIGSNKLDISRSLFRKKYTFSTGSKMRTIGCGIIQMQKYLAAFADRFTQTDKGNMEYVRRRFMYRVIWEVETILVKSLNTLVDALAMYPELGENWTRLTEQRGFLPPPLREHEENLPRLLRSMKEELKTVTETVTGYSASETRLYGPTVLRHTSLDVPTQSPKELLVELCVCCVRKSLFDKRKTLLEGDNTDYDVVREFINTEMAEHMKWLSQSIIDQSIPANAPSFSPNVMLACFLCGITGATGFPEKILGIPEIRDCLQGLWNVRRPGYGEGSLGEPIKDLMKEILERDIEEAELNSAVNGPKYTIGLKKTTTPPALNMKGHLANAYD
ncbi:hypothetical protein BDV96DRAFT_651224 [Lophiotrema nucula]|uniref:Uncharacterized protein n=1 Tax=Lophiotrema nucula TaxID=690887 RepID=A0A6A5YV93_9PLEO|nr:hypothetical protein BDV96DRAFT_651224 [Lophiotrema nucula]